MKIVILTVFVMCGLFVYAQPANTIIQQGNELYNQKDYSGAQQQYEKALTEDPYSDAGNYNLGNSYYQQQEFEKAAAQFEHATQTATDPETRANAYHNLGNTYLQQKKYEESINAYKQSLRDKPADNDTKYNLAYAQQMLKKQQQQQQQQQQKQDLQKKEEQKKQDQQPKQDNNQNKNEQQQKDKQQPAPPKEYSKEELDRILESLNADDKNVQEKVNKQKSQNAGGDAEKDW